MTASARPTAMAVRPPALLRFGSGAWRRPAPGAKLWLLVAVALLAHLALLPRGVYVGDLQGFVAIANQVGVHGPQSLYDPPELTTFRESYAIPPMIPFLLAASFWAAGAMRSLVSGGWPGMLATASSPAVFDLPAPLAAGVIKLWATCADLAIGVAIYRWVTPRAGAPWAWVAAAAFLLNPGVLYDSAVWGQVDSVLALCVVLALFNLADSHTARSWAWLAAGLLIKPQAVVALPLVAYITLVRHGWHRLATGAAAAAAVGAVITAPFWLTGRAGQIVQVYANSIGTHTRVSVNAFNLWWAVGGPNGGVLVWKNDLERSTLGPLSVPYRQIGLAAMAAYLALAVGLLTLAALRVRQPSTWPAGSAAAPRRLGGLRGEQIVLAAGALYVAFFMLPTEIHERYLFPALPLLAATLYASPALLPAFATLSLGYVVNLIYLLPFSPGAIGWLIGTGLASQRVAMLNVAGFVAVTVALVDVMVVGPRRHGQGAGPDLHPRLTRAVILTAALDVALLGAAAQVVPGSVLGSSDLLYGGLIAAAPLFAAAWPWASHPRAASILVPGGRFELPTKGL